MASIADNNPQGFNEVLTMIQQLAGEKVTLNKSAQLEHEWGVILAGGAALVSSP